MGRDRDVLEIKTGNRFCVYCGDPVSQGEHTKKPSSASKKAKRNNMPVIAIITVALIAAILSVWWIFFRGTKINAANFPDAHFRKKISFFDKNNNGVLSREEKDVVKVINVSYDRVGLVSLKGIEYFRALEELNCNDNYLVGLDVSRNAKLKDLYCAGNDIIGLDLSHNPDLKNFYARTMDSQALTSGTTLHWNGLIARAMNLRILM